VTRASLISMCLHLQRVINHLSSDATTEKCCR